MARSAPTASKGKLVIISGPSGVGKSTVCRRLAELDPDVELSISATTRPPRENERDGVDYFFLTREEFERKIERGELAEHAEYAGELYGTPKEQLEAAMAAGRVILMDIDTAGTAQVVAAYPDATTIFLEPPDFDELLCRLNVRNTDTFEAKRKRLEIAEREMKRRKDYKHRVVNDDLDTTVKQVHSIIIGEAG